VFVVFGILIATPLSATVNPGEIIPGSVTVTVPAPGIFDPVNGVSITFQWQTVHPGNSIVVIENDLDYQGNDNSSSRQIVQNDFTTNHVVVMDHFPEYSIDPTWGFYVASQVIVGRCNMKSAECSAWATYPGPPTAACGSYCYIPFSLPSVTSPYDPTGPLVFSMWPVGGENVYQGDPTQSPACTPTAKSSRECNDLYVVTQANLLSGSPQAIVEMQQVVITDLDTGQIVTNNSITAQYLCDLDAPWNPPPQGWDGDYNSSNEACSNGTLYTTNSTMRLRVNSQAVPGHYQFTAQFQGMLNGLNTGNATPMTYNFTVLPTASFTATPPTTFPTIAGISTWQNNMVKWNAPSGTDDADFWCTNVTDTDPWWSLDNGNFSGWMDIPAGIYFEAWNYDGGRVYQQVLDYDVEVFGDQNQAHLTEWHRCSELAMEPYKDTDIGTAGGFVQEPNQFPFGLAMNYMRTGDPTYQDAVNLLAFNPAYFYWFSGSVYAESVRVSAYMMDDRLANEIIGAPRDTAFMLRAVDVMLGYLDQSYNLSLSNPNQQEYNIHPFMVGLAMEALITYYELDVAEGNTPDARIPLEIKKVLDWWEATQYIPTRHDLAYDPYDLPKNPQLVPGTLYEATELNDLVATVYAWYWYKTGNNTYLTEGDDLFSWVWHSAGGQTLGGNGGWTWSVKEYNQIYKWSFDYVRWRSGANPDGSQPPVETVLASQNPYSGPLTDYTTPVQFFWTPAQNGQVAAIDPKLSDSPNTVTVTATTATIYLNVFKPNTTMQVWYGTAAPPNCNSEDPAPPYCMQPFPNFGFLQMLNASYPYQSTITTGVPDQLALSQGIPNIYDETLTITGLSPNTTYHWRPLTTDSLGNMAAYTDEMFTTSAQ
jgi:hypothetical protein